MRFSAPTALLAAAGLLAVACGDGGASTDPASALKGRAVLHPASVQPLRLRGTGFRARERVRVTVTPSTTGAVTRRVRASRTGSFEVGFGATDACGGFEATAAGSHGSRASIQFSSLTCP
jgi:hypothetical protein